MLNVFYDPQQVVKQPGHTSPSSGKPREVVEEWLRLHFPILIRETEPVSIEEISLAHDPQYVKGILSGEVINGFGNTSAEVAKSLSWTTGSLWSAARAVMTEKNLKVACSPTSGFHHATYNSASGFCTFNGLMVTALLLKKHKLANRIGILDLDHHWGNGTHEIISRLGLRNWIRHYTIGGERIKFKETNWRGLTGADDFMSRLPAICEWFGGCQILLYQAGADLWEKDPFAWHGGLTVDQLKERDIIVFETMNRMGIPCVWNLAGGYVRDESGSIQPVLNIHNNTAKACIEAYGLGFPT